MTQSQVKPLPENIDSQDPQRVELSKSQTSWLLFSVLIVALCGIAYELIIAAVSSYLLGNSVAQFSITIGLFMFSMGIGSYLSKFIAKDLVFRFVQIEVAVALVGGLSAILLFLVFPYFGLYHAVMYLLTLVIGILVGLEIPILTRILTGSGSVSESLAHVLSLDYLGALIGSVGFPLLLLPRLGLFRSSFGIGILNIAIAGLAIIVLRKNCARLRSLRLLVLFTAGILIGGLIFSAQIARYAEGMLFADEVIYQEQSPYQRVVFTKNARNGELRLYLDGHLQFAQSDEYRYHESLVHPAMSCGGMPKRILVLGGGDGLAIREVLK
ncbi:MAG: polyamine aminopropyltransferase, partial [Planctomycetes bacterium]|nr:polyamine aminopropyltransferase [Planctomycetota bacterium]